MQVNLFLQHFDFPIDIAGLSVKHFFLVMSYIDTLPPQEVQYHRIIQEGLYI